MWLCIQMRGAHAVEPLNNSKAWECWAYRPYRNIGGALLSLLVLMF